MSYSEDSNSELIPAPRGHYQLNVMPIGINIATKVFQRPINKRSKFFLQKKKNQNKTKEEKKIPIHFLNKENLSSIYELYYLGNKVFFSLKFEHTYDLYSISSL